MHNNLLKGVLNNLWLFVIILLIVAVSFTYYAPCFYYDYNSDQAIQSLMSVSFNFKRDFFYWGQNRLGSFLPMITYLFFKLTHFHPLYLISIIHYVLLFASGIIISTFIHNNWVKIAVFVVIFFPVSDYRAIILIGHPYSVQLFCGSIFLFTVGKIYDIILPTINQAFSKSSLPVLILVSLINALSFCIGFWTSELSVILILIPIVNLLLDRKILNELLHNTTFYIALGIFIIVSTSFFFLFYIMKKQSPPDQIYDHPFFFSPEKLNMQFNFLILRIKANLLYDNLLYCLLCILSVLFLILKRDKTKNMVFAGFYNSVLFTLFISCILLFFSTWNFRSEFCIRYYTPLYFLFMPIFFIAIDKKFSFKKASLLSVIFILFSSCSTYIFFAKTDADDVSAFKKHNEFSGLPKGTLIAGY